MESPHGGLFDFLPIDDMENEVLDGDQDAITTAKLALSMQLHSSANYDSDKFYALFKKLSGSADRGFDGKIRIQALKVEELSPGQIA